MWIGDQMHGRCTHTQTYTHTHKHTLNQYSPPWCYVVHKTENAYICVRAYVNTYTQQHLSIHVNRCNHMHIHAYTCKYMRVYMYMYIHVYIELYTKCMHIQTHIHMSLWTQSKATNPSSNTLHTHTNTLSHTNITNSHILRANTVLTSSPPTHIIYIFKRAQDSDFQNKNVQIFCFLFSVSVSLTIFCHNTFDADQHDCVDVVEHHFQKKNVSWMHAYKGMGFSTRQWKCPTAQK